VAALLGCEPDSIVFTASGSEANNLAIKGVTVNRRPEGEHIITTAIEHPAVLNACRYLERRHGYRSTIVAVGQTGLVDPDEIRGAIQPGTVVISVMHANNEVRTLQPIEEIAALARECGIAVTPMPRSRSAKSGPPSTNWGWTCSRWLATSCTPRKESARSTFGPGHSSSR
jgi:cysteine desulfurase